MRISKKRKANIITVIPARGGSKGVPKKNIRKLKGKPLIQYSIEYSLKCPLVSHTVVSTESQKIADIARKKGAEIRFLRPSEYAQDDTPDYPVMRHALDTLEKVFQEAIDYIILLRPTSPLRPQGLIERGMKIFKRFPECSSIRSVSPCSQHPYRMWKIVNGFMTGYEDTVHEPYNLPRQKLPLVYFQTGDIEIIRRDTLMKGSVSGDKILPLIIGQDEIFDIDKKSDLKRATERLNGKV